MFFIEFDYITCYIIKILSFIEHFGDICMISETCYKSIGVEKMNKNK